MLVRCPDCTTKYEIAASLIPQNGVKVRCPKCKAVFPVSRTATSSPKPAPIAGNIGPKSEAWVESDAQAAPVSAAPHTETAVEAPPVKKKITDPKVAERLARAVVQELLYGRTQERRRALERGASLSTFGGALADAFDVYRERVSEELPGAKAIFLEAVNDILGEGTTLL